MITQIPAPPLNEEWRPVVGFEGRYEVSSLGSVRNVTTGKVLRAPLCTSGYPHLNLSAGCGVRKAAVVHQLVASAFIGPRQGGMQVDHINRDKSDNRLLNLRYVTPSQNKCNSQKSGPTGSVAYKGVHIAKGRFRAQIQVRYKVIRLGSFDTAEEAARAYDAAAIKYHGAFAVLNFPSESIAN